MDLPYLDPLDSHKTCSKKRLNFSGEIGSKTCKLGGNCYFFGFAAAQDFNLRLPVMVNSFPAKSFKSSFESTLFSGFFHENIYRLMKVDLSLFKSLTIPTYFQSWTIDDSCIAFFHKLDLYSNDFLHAISIPYETGYSKFC